MSIEQGRIPPLAAGAMVTGIVLATAVLTLPGIMIGLAERDAWLSVLLATVFGLFVISLMVILCANFPGQTLIEITETLLGRPGRWVIGGAYTWWLLHVASLAVRSTIDFILSELLPRTPISVIAVSLFLVMLWGARAGVEVIARQSPILFALDPILVILTALLSSMDLRPANLLPVLAEGVGPVLKGSYPALGFFGEVAVAGFAIFPFVNQPRRLWRIGIIGVLVTGVALAIGLVTATMVLSAPIAGNDVSPIDRTVRYISIGAFLERIDPAFISTGFLTMALKATLYLYAALLTGAQWLGLRDYRCLGVPFAIVAATLAIFLHTNAVELKSFVVLAWTPYSFVFEVAIPLVLLALTIRHRAQRG